MKKISVLLVITLLIAACKPAAAPTSAPTAVPTRLTPSATPVPPTATTQPSPTPIPPTATPQPAPALPPDPQPVNFSASDGQALSGLFYPADHYGAPVVVLIHWFNGDQSDWYEVAPWLQNRGLKNPFRNPGRSPWWDPSWFPAVSAGTSYNVFIFSLRGCQPAKTGCTETNRSDWLLDIQAALQTAASLDQVDASRLAVIGSSIGADGAADGCAGLNTQVPGQCKGALSLSPGNYLGVPYASAIQELSEAQPSSPAWCLADEKEIGICRNAGKYDTYQVHEIPGGSHGTMLLSPDLDPLPMQLILDFLKLVLS